MKYVILTVRDKKAAAFSQPFFAPTLIHGIRSFHDAVTRPGDDNMMSKHPDDFELYAVGTFDDFEGRFETQLPSLVASASEALPAKQSMINEAVDQYVKEKPNTKVVGV